MLRSDDQPSALDDDFSSVRRKVAALLKRCFGEEDSRPSAGWCRAKLISMWGRWDRESPWADYERELKPPRRSPCVFGWGDHERVAMFYRVSQLTTELLIDRYSTAPDNVKTYTEIVNFLDKLYEKKVYALQKGADRAEKNRQKKYQKGVSSVSSTPTTESSSFNSAPDSEGFTNMLPNSFVITTSIPPSFSTTSIPDSKISSSFSDEHQTAIEAAQNDALS